MRSAIMDRGIAGERMVAEGLGESRLLFFPERNRAQWEANRRVEFIAVEEQGPHRVSVAPIVLSPPSIVPRCC